MKVRQILLAATVAIWVGVMPAQAAPLVPIGDLIEKAAQYDGQMVTVEGEAVGDLMLRGSHGWVNISDPTGDLGLYAPTDLLRQIGHVGRYRSKGDRVRASGRFHRADTQHGGDMDLHVESLRVVGMGGRVVHPVSPRRLWVTGLAVALALAVSYLFRLRTHARRAG